MRPLTPRSQWLRGLDLNQRPLGYEGDEGRDRSQGGARLRRRSAELQAIEVGAAWGALVPVRGENAGGWAHAFRCFSQ